MADMFQSNPHEFEDACNLWMGNLSSDMDESFITSAFRARNFELVAVRFAKNTLVEGTTHHCFIEFPSADIAKSALQKLNHQPIPGLGDGRKFELNWASNVRDTGGQKHNLHVRNLSAEVDTSELLEFFQTNYPSVVSAIVVRDDNGSSLGFGYVTFLDADERDQSMAELDGLTIVGTKPVSLQATESPDPQSSGLDPVHGLSTAVYAYGGYVYGTKTNQVNFHEGTQYQLGPVSTAQSNKYAANYSNGQPSIAETIIDAKQLARGSIANPVASFGGAYSTNTNGGHTVPFASLDISNAELIEQEKCRPDPPLVEIGIMVGPGGGGGRILVTLIALIADLRRLKRLFKIMQEAKWDLQFNRKLLAASTVAGFYNL